MTHNEIVATLSVEIVTDRASDAQYSDQAYSFPQLVRAAILDYLRCARGETAGTRCVSMRMRHTA
jgi:hypothetical protein